MLKIERDLHRHGDPDRGLKEGASMLFYFGGAVVLVLVCIGLIVKMLIG